MSLKVMITGARGRMGQTLLNIAADLDADIVSAVDVGDDPLTDMHLCQVLIDFSFHEATADLVAAAAERGKAVVIGTTGHSAAERQRIIAATSRIPIVWAGNYSVGVNLLMHLVRESAHILGSAYHAEILEMHHSHKRDAPSGTALNLAEAVQDAPDWQDAPLINGREGITGERSRTEIGMHAIRGGEIVGDHTAFFIGPDDRIELTHRASNRGIFARGAFRAARWAATQKPGLYNMQDVLGLRK